MEIGGCGGSKDGALGLGCLEVWAIRGLNVLVKCKSCSLTVLNEFEYRDVGLNVWSLSLEVTFSGCLTSELRIVYIYTLLEQNYALYGTHELAEYRPWIDIESNNHFGMLWIPNIGKRLKANGDLDQDMFLCLMRDR